MSTTFPFSHKTCVGLQFAIFELHVKLTMASVEHYDLDKGLIYFSEPHYDKNLHSKDYIQVVAGVEISIVDVKAEQLEAGNWMNVIGYIDETKYKPLINGDKMVQGIKIRAQLIWDTGTMDVRAYFGSIAARKKTFD